MQLLLVVDVWRRGPGRQHLAGITAPEKEPRRRREAGGGDHGPVVGSSDGGRQEAGITALSMDPAAEGDKRRDHDPDDGSGDGRMQEAGITALSIDPSPASLRR